MILENEVRIKDFKCFNNNGEGFEKIFPLNIIIGKNNSGKSSLIELIQFLVEGNASFFENQRDNRVPEVIISHSLTGSDIEKIFQRNTQGGYIGGNHYDYASRFIGKKLKYKLEDGNKREFIGLDAEYRKEITREIEKLALVVPTPLKGKTFCNISAERDINPEHQNDKLSLSSNGTGATNYIQQIINKENRDSNLIEEELLTELNKIIQPDISFKRILVQSSSNNLWEIYFIDSHNNRVALSKMGSGIKTIILVLLNLIVKPEIEHKNPSSFVFAFEELENNLHPSLQRRLYNYIQEYSKENNAYFFLTTHSNVVIDSFSTSKLTQLLHITSIGDSSTCKTVISYSKTKHIIEDLGIKASDILQTNGVIWVEGPSDRNYINKWIELLDSNLKEGLHYSIMFYGGRLLSNLSFDFDWLRKELIPLLKINRNAFVVIDRDGKGIKAKLSETKKRIAEEIGEGNCWITKGREIENYLTNSTINNWLKEEHKISTSVENNKDVKIENNIIDSRNDIKLDYSSNKTIFSAEIINYINQEDIDVLDLKPNVLNLIQQIKIWNA